MPDKVFAFSELNIKIPTIEESSSDYIMLVLISEVVAEETLSFENFTKSFTG